MTAGSGSSGRGELHQLRCLPDGTAIQGIDRDGSERFDETDTRPCQYGRHVAVIGSAALDLAYVAAGRFDAYWERGLNISGMSPPAPRSCS